MTVNLLGTPFFQLNFFMRGLIFSVALIVALHYGLLLIKNGSHAFKNKDMGTVLLVVVYVVAAGAVFYYLTSISFGYKILFYILTVLYLLVVLSRGFVNWYSRTEEISKKLDRIIELLEKKA